MEKNSKKTYKGIDIYYDLLGTGEYWVSMDNSGNPFMSFMFDAEAQAKRAIDNKNAYIANGIIKTLKYDFKYHNKNLTKKQDYAIDDCIEALKIIVGKVRV